MVLLYQVKDEAEVKRHANLHIHLGKDTQDSWDFMAESGYQVLVCDDCV